MFQKKRSKQLKEQPKQIILNYNNQMQKASILLNEGKIEEALKGLISLGSKFWDSLTYAELKFSLKSLSDFAKLQNQSRDFSKEINNIKVKISNIIVDYFYAEEIEGYDFEEKFFEKIYTQIKAIIKSTFKQKPIRRRNPQINNWESNFNFDINLTPLQAIAISLGIVTSFILLLSLKHITYDNDDVETLTSAPPDSLVSEVIDENNNISDNNSTSEILEYDYTNRDSQNVTKSKTPGIYTKHDVLKWEKIDISNIEIIQFDSNKHIKESTIYYDFNMISGFCYLKNLPKGTILNINNVGLCK